MLQGNIQKEKRHRKTEFCDSSKVIDSKLHPLKVSKYRKQISKVSFEPKTGTKNFCPSFKKAGQNFFVHFLVQMKTLEFVFDIY